MTGTRHRQPIYYEVVKFLQENPLGGTNDGHKWLSLLMKHEQHAMRMVAVRGKDEQQRAGASAHREHGASVGEDDNGRQ